jgi:hypothetical protein
MMALSTDEYIELIRALTAWAEVAPNEPALGFLQGDEMLTPRQLLDAVDDSQNPDGAAFLEMLEHAVRRDGIDSVTSRLNDSVGFYEHG